MQKTCKQSDGFPVAAAVRRNLFARTVGEVSITSVACTWQLPFTWKFVTHSCMAYAASLGHPKSFRARKPLHVWLFPKVTSTTQRFGPKSSPTLAVLDMPLRIFFKETLKSSAETSFPVMPSMLPREGGSAILLEEGTRANHEFTPAAS